MLTTRNSRQAVAGAVYLGQLAATLPPGINASSVVEALDTLRSHSDWPQILRALSLAIKVRYSGLPWDPVC